MAYEEVSEYGYITGDELEAYMALIFLEVDAKYTEASVMAKVTMAELWINSRTQTTFTGTIPDGVKFATLLLARYFIEIQLINDGYLEKLSETLGDVMRLAESAIATSIEDIGVQSLSTNGADRTYYPSLP